MILHWPCTHIADFGAIQPDCRCVVAGEENPSALDFSEIRDIEGFSKTKQAFGRGVVADVYDCARGYPTAPAQILDDLRVRFGWSSLSEKRGCGESARETDEAGSK